MILKPMYSCLSYKEALIKQLPIQQQIDTAKYSAVIIGVHDFSYRPANNYGISAAAMNLWTGLQKDNVATFYLGMYMPLKTFAMPKTW